MRLLRVAGILLGLAGILVVLTPGTSLPDPDMALWLLLAFGSPVCYAFGSVAVVFLRPAGRQTDSADLRDRLRKRRPDGAGHGRR